MSLTCLQRLATVGLAVAAAMPLAGSTPVAAVDRDEAVSITEPFGPGVRFELRWDQVGERLIASHDVNNSTEASIALFDRHGRMLRTLQPMVDFAGRRARRLDIWDVTMAPDGTLWFAAVIGFQSHRVSHIIANYDANGKPKKVWDMFPYHHHQIAVDESGKVYAFGHRIDAQQTPPYPLLIRYTARGQIDAPLLIRLCQIPLIRS